VLNALRPNRKKNRQIGRCPILLYVLPTKGVGKRVYEDRKIEKGHPRKGQAGTKNNERAHWTKNLTTKG